MKHFFTLFVIVGKPEKFGDKCNLRKEEELTE
jgi:hypothetical protein